MQPVLLAMTSRSTSDLALKFHAVFDEVCLIIMFLLDLLLEVVLAGLARRTALRAMIAGLPTQSRNKITV